MKIACWIYKKDSKETEVKKPNFEEGTRLVITLSTDVAIMGTCSHKCTYIIFSSSNVDQFIDMSASFYATPHWCFFLSYKVENIGLMNMDNTESYYFMEK